MPNPSEELVIAWLQTHEHLFTMSNIKIPRPRGGMGAEIDILAMNDQKKVWIEVTVSTNPRRNYKPDVLFESVVNDCISDFKRQDKSEYVAKIFGPAHERWLIYGQLPLKKDDWLIAGKPALKKEDQTRFSKEIWDKHRIMPVYFGKIFKELSEAQQYFQLDPARRYINLFMVFKDALDKE